MRGGDEVHAVGDLFGAGDLQSLAFVQGCVEASLEHGVVSTGVKLGSPAIKGTHIELVAFQVEAVQVAEFKLFAGGSSRDFARSTTWVLAVA